MHKIVLAITGASGAIYAKQIMEKLQTIPSQWDALGIVMTENARQVWETELGDSSYTQFTDQPHPKISSWSTRDFNAPFASGSGKYNTMIIAPCSMGTLGRIAGGISSDLISRAADVVLKERRRLICVVRETPYNLIHIRNMEAVTLAGGIICPATPSYYSRPASMEELAATVTDRILDLAGLDIKTFRWGKEQ